MIAMKTSGPAPAAFFAALILTGVLSGVLSDAMADRPPDDEERQAVENALRAAGFASWEEIEFDDDDDDAEDRVWEVDDAIGADGTEYDLKLDRNFNIIKRDPD